MPEKIFTTINGACPFGKNAMIDSPACRACDYFYRVGTATFFWCRHPGPKAAAHGPKAEKATPEKRKRGRPPGKATKTPKIARKTKKR